MKKEMAWGKKKRNQGGKFPPREDECGSIITTLFQQFFPLEKKIRYN